MQSAEVLKEESVTHAHGVAIPTAETVIFTDDAREAVAAQFEDIARRLRSKELSGARCEWNDSETQPYMVRVEIYKPEGPGVGWVRMVRTKFEPTAARMRVVNSAGE